MTEAYWQIIGGRIRAARLERKMVQRQLGRAVFPDAGERSGLELISRIELGRSTTSVDRMVAIARALDKPVAWFFEGVE